MRTRFLALALAIPLAAFAGACDNGNDASTTDSAARDTTPRAARGDSSTTEDVKTTSGSGSLTVNGTAYEFTSDACAIGDGETPTVNIAGRGNTGGRDYTVIVKRTKQTSYVETITLAWSGTEASVATNLGSADETKLKVDDRNVEAPTLSFTGGGGAPSGDGNLTVDCSD